MTISLEEHVAREPELLPCPFCGGRMLFRAALWPSDGNCDGFIHAEPTDCPLGAFEDGSSDRSIIDKWNARAAVAAVHEREGAKTGIGDDEGFIVGVNCGHDEHAPDAAEDMRAKCAEVVDAEMETWREAGHTDDGDLYRQAHEALVTLKPIKKRIAALKGNGEG